MNIINELGSHNNTEKLQITPDSNLKKLDKQDRVIYSQQCKFNIMQPGSSNYKQKWKLKQMVINHILNKQGYTKNITSKEKRLLS